MKRLKRSWPGGIPFRARPLPDDGARGGPTPDTSAAPDKARRAAFAALLGCLAGGASAGTAAAPGDGRDQPPDAEISPSRRLKFPQDFGAHPQTRIEWWYLTGWLSTTGADTPLFGFQVTFFRSRTQVDAHHPSAFAAKQLVFAHAALTDLPGRRLLHDDRLARDGFGLAGAATGDTAVSLRGWSLRRSPGAGDASVYEARVDSERAGFALALQARSSQPVLLQGQAGYSRKGARPEQASHYYSQPQLPVRGSLTRGGKPRAVQGRAWLDHEWSNSVLDEGSVGWDWIGINLLDGGALTAFRLRRADGGASHAGGSFRPAGAAQASSFAAADVRFTPMRWWTSPASNARYPVEWRIATPAGEFQLRALLDAQELDSRGSTGTIYWEGLSELLDGQGRRLGWGYLEMTGYAARLKL